MKTRFLGVMALAAFSMLPSASMAQSFGIGIHLGNDRGWRDGDRVAYDRGFEQGTQRGRSDARHNERSSFWRDGNYRSADSGYRREFGPRDRYVESYRRGYEAGYQRSFDFERSERVGKSDSY